MTDPATGQRSYLQALKVPFDLKGVAAGALAWWSLTLLGRVLGWQGGLVRELMNLSRGSGRFEASSPSEWVGETVAMVVVGAIFGVACCRIAAMRLARDEGTDLGAAFSFSFGNLGASLGAVFFLVAAAGFFALCNVMAGIAAGVPGVGPFASFLLFPLAMLSGFLLFLVLFGAVMGGPLVAASIAVERNGALDAVSRAFSYVYGRTVLFFFYGLTVWFITSVLGTCTILIEELIRWTLTMWLPDGESWRSMATALRAAGEAAASLRMPNLGGSPWDVVVWGWSAWLFGLLLHLALVGWVYYYFFGGATAAYFALRRDVDGTEEEEIWVEGEDREKFGEPEKPKPAGAGDASPATPPGAPPAKG
jgi:hypothetical protein